MRWMLVALLLGCQAAPPESEDAAVDAARDAWVFVPVPDAEVSRDAEPLRCSDAFPDPRPWWVEDLDDPSLEVPSCTPETVEADCAGLPFTSECWSGRCCDTHSHLFYCFNCLSHDMCALGCAGGQCVGGCRDDCDCARRDPSRPFCFSEYPGHAPVACHACRDDDDCPADRPRCSFENYTCGAR